MDYFKNMDNFELNRFHSVIFFILTVFLSGSGLFGVYFLPLEKKIPSIFSVICFFLIATIGVSHGALDNLKGAQLLKKFKIKKLKENTSYTSLNNEKFLNIKELKILISKYKKN